VVCGRGFVTLLELFLKVGDLLAEFRDFIAERPHFRFEGSHAGINGSGCRSLTSGRGGIAGYVSGEQVHVA
jgi:hypothetical protein